MAKLKKPERQQQLKEKLHQTPFITDEELADFFGVSVPTIRLDRLELGIPELRERIKAMAQEHALEYNEGSRPIHVTGELLEITMGKSGLSLLIPTDDMVDEHGIVEPHHLYAQAYSLAKAIVGYPVAITGVGNVKYKSPARRERKLIAKAEVVRRRGEKIFVWVFIKDRDREVYRAKFIIDTYTMPMVEPI